MKIRSFKCKQTEQLYLGISTRHFCLIAKQARRKLRMLDAAESLVDLYALPSNHLGKLKGDRTGQYSIHINSQWRICFKYASSGIDEVEIVDYHRGNFMPKSLSLISPGEILKKEFMGAYHLNMNTLAKAIHVPANRIHAILRGQRSITADTALRLARLFKTTPQFWLNLQMIYDLECVQHTRGKYIERYIQPLKEAI